MNRYLGLIFLILLSSCTSKTEYGNCVGVSEDQDPKKIYKVSTGNVIVAVIFWELIAPPVYVIFDETYCPVGVK